MRTTFVLVAAMAVGAPGLALADDLDAAARGKTALCTDGKGRYLAIAPDEQATTRLYWGGPKSMKRVTGGARFMSGDWFWDPRFYQPTNNDNFRGLDLRLFSHADYDAAKRSCAVTCGARTVPLAIVPEDEARALVEKATFEAAPAGRVPHALARDQRAVYYYVDKGNTPETERSFRLYVGPKGAMKLQQMTDVASDSEGEIFATKTGSLRLILGKKESSWVRGKKAEPLTLVPVEQNYRMIYTELGVYAGVKLGTPCDDL
jgi:hypothetical protein